MIEKSVTIIDGFEEPNALSERCLAELRELLQKDNDAVNIIPLRERKLAHCVGCFECWLKTPGLCRFKDDQEQVLKGFLLSHTCILFSPVSFGGYSSLLKRAVDRIIPLGHPMMGMYHRETHHVPRYNQYPRLVTIGVKETASRQEKRIFRILTARNALNFHSPSWASAIITNDAGDRMKETLCEVLEQKDPIPERSELISMMQYSNPPAPSPTGPENALLVVGSPKLNPSNSKSIGSYLSEQLENLGWHCNSLTLNASLFKNRGLDKFLEAIKKTRLIILAFPLYVDALPCLVTKALETITAHKSVLSLEGKRLAVVINNGFPEHYHNAPAISICKHFVKETGLYYAGHLALGSGEALIQEKAINDEDRSGLPIAHVEQALIDTAAALNKGHCIPDSSARRMARSPIPLLPFGLWRRLFIFLAGIHWKQRSGRYGLNAKDLGATPYTP